MNWIDYRKKLGIGFEDVEKAKCLSNRLSVLLDIISSSNPDDEESICRKYFIDVYEKPLRYYAWNEVKKSIERETETCAMLSKAIVLANCFYLFNHVEGGFYIESYIKQALDDLDLQYEIIRDNDGFFVFPKGAKELDEAIVSIPFEWLQNYPSARHAMTHALLEYSRSSNYSNVADLFRKALETFFQSFFKSKKTLENLKSDYGQFMKEHGIPKELSNTFETILQMYTNFINNNAKHADKTKKECLEFIMYQTGNIIRFMISLKNASDRN
ncbi:MAG: hypothetical protein IKH09_09900 [Clostridia bacterium]|nr:hypothetical protein [Clostridia bacterium]